MEVEAQISNSGLEDIFGNTRSDLSASFSPDKNKRNSQIEQPVSQEAYYTSASATKHKRRTKKSKALLNKHLAILSTRKGFCAFCHIDIETKQENLGHATNAYIIERMLKYFEKDPAGLLLVHPTCEKQQRYFESIYEQMQTHKVAVPSLISQAFGLMEKADYKAIKTDPSFLYSEFRICNECYECVKKMT